MSRRKRRFKPDSSADHYTTRDSMLVRRAIREGWDTEPEMRLCIAHQIAETAINGVTPALATSAARTFLAMLGANWGELD